MEREKYHHIFFNILGILIVLLTTPIRVNAQAEVKIASSLSWVDVFLNVVHWGLMLIVLLGIVTMPIAGLAWYKKNRAEHVWVDFFKSGSFAVRALVIVVAFILWSFKIVDYITFLIV